MLTLSADRKAFPLLNTPFNETHGQISPDGKRLAYLSNETGRAEVYVRPFPTGAGKWQVSTSGGYFPRWRRDGRELFYMDNLSGGKLMAVEIKASGSAFEPGTPKELFDTGYINLPHSSGIYNPFAVSADGQRFLIPRPTSSATEDAHIAVVVNWTAALRK